jgi:hypothetical protein
VDALCKEWTVGFFVYLLCFFRVQE